MKISRVIVLCLVFFLTGTLFVQAQDQPKIDSLFQMLRTSRQDTNKVILLYKLSREFFNSDMDRAEKYSNRALFLSEKLGYKRGIAMSYNNLGIINYYRAIYNVALNYHERSLEIMSEIGDRKGMAGSFNNKGAVYTQQGEYKRAIAEYLSSLSIYEELQDEEGVGKSYNNIGLVYYLQGNYNEAMGYYNKALTILQQYDNPSVIADIMNNMGIIAFLEGEYDKSLDFHFKSLDIREKEGNQRGMASSYTNIGDVFAADETFQKAIEYQQKALQIQEELGDKKGMLSSLQGMGKIMKTTGQPEKAINYFSQVVNLSRQIGAKAELKDVYRELSELHKERGNWKDAYSFMASYSQIKDTLFSVQAGEMTASMEAKFENEKKAKEIELLKRENEIQVLQLARNRTLIISFTIGAILAFISIVIFARTYRERKRAYKLLQEQNIGIKKQKEEKEVLLKEIHHRVKNNLQVINSLIRLQSAYTEDRRALELFDECQNRIISMALIHEQMYESKDLSNINIREYIIHLAQNLIRTYRLSSRIEMDIEVQAHHLSLDTLVPLGLLLNEFISNSLKHAFQSKNEGAITVRLTKNVKGMYELLVGDNGIGLPRDFNFQSAHTLGMELIVTLTQQLDGSIERVNLDQEGSYFKLEFAGLEKDRPDIKHIIQPAALAS